MFNRRRSLMALNAGIVSLWFLAGAGSAATAAAQSPSDQTTSAVRRAIQRLPDYGVFDHIAFTIDRGAVTLIGYAVEEKLRADAEAAVKQASSVEDVVNRIEVLPVSQYDDRIRWATFYRIYTDDFLSRYVPGGARQVLDELRSQQYFPGIRPAGPYPIRIIVKNGRTTLLGVVDSAADRRIAGVRAREVTGAFEVENALTLARERGK
jgi:osmotically-inducible protein OsmY